MFLSSRVAHDSSFSDVSPDGSLDASLHLNTPTFPHNLAVWSCFAAATDSPCWTPSSTTHAARGGHCPPSCFASAQAGGGTGWGVSAAPPARRTSLPFPWALHLCAPSLSPTSHWTLRAF